MTRTITTIAATSVLCMLGVAAPAAAASAQAGDLKPRFSYGKFQPYSEDANAITYDERVPRGATSHFSSLSLPDGSTKIAVTLTGLEPNREYGAHVHTNPCGPAGSDAGPHFQDVPDPEQPSTNPEYANPDNEVWLDFTTDAAGNATVVEYGDWQLQDRKANSFVIHEHHTLTDPGEAGEAGDRLACMNVDF